jgi:hypothetical protein
MLHGYPDDFERYVGALDLGSDMTGFYEYNMQKKLMLNWLYFTVTVNIGSILEYYM